MKPIQSPCIHHCTLNEQDVCMGCFRHISEITSWNASSDHKRQHILNNTKKRRSQHMEQFLHHNQK